MAAKDMPAPRTFTPNPPQTKGPPLCLGLAGPPGGGKTVSALRIARGMSRVFGGKPALIDTEAGRSLKYRKGPQNPDGFEFDYFEFSAPFVPAHFLDAIHAAAELNPPAIIVDNASDEHEGPGGVLEWHDRNVPNMGGNEWAAWNAPKQSRRMLTSGIQQIRIPIILTFRARPKTTTPAGQRNPVKLGYMPIAGEELLGIVDLMCLLPPKSNGVATWSSRLAGEDFTIKIPYYLARFIEEGRTLDEDLGETLALWQSGRVDPSGNVIRDGNGSRKRTPEELTDAYVLRVNAIGRLEGGGDDTSGAAFDELRAFQMAEGTSKFLAGLRDTRPDLYQRASDATSKRADALSPAAEVDDDDGAEFPGDLALDRPGED